MSLVEKMYTCLPDSFIELKNQVDELGKVKTFTIIEFADCTYSYDDKATMVEAIDSLFLPTLQNETVKKSIEFLKTLTPAELLNMKQWFMRHIVAISEDKFCLFALQIEFSDVEKSVLSRLQFYEYIFYASLSDVESLENYNF